MFVDHHRSTHAVLDCMVLDVFGRRFGLYKPAEVPTGLKLEPLQFFGLNDCLNFIKDLNIDHQSLVRLIHQLEGYRNLELEAEEACHRYFGQQLLSKHFALCELEHATLGDPFKKPCRIYSTWGKVFDLGAAEHYFNCNKTDLVFFRKAEDIEQFITELDIKHRHLYYLPRTLGIRPYALIIQDGYQDELFSTFADMLKNGEAIVVKRRPKTTGQQDVFGIQRFTPEKRVEQANSK